MSLCVAWKYEDRQSRGIYFASDSCAVVGEHVMPYGGIKVLEIPVRVISAIDANTGHADVLFRGSYGMAFVGVYFAAFLLKELVSEVLSHVQFMGSQDGLSFDLICELVADFHRHFLNQIRNHLPAHHALDFFLGGYCPRSRRVRVAKFTVDITTGQSRHKEILLGDNFSCETIGVDDGRSRFRELMDLSLIAPCPTHLAAFRRLWDVIRTPEIRFVKGAVQYGEFDGREFKLRGSFELRREAEQLVPRTYIRGTDVEKVRNPEGPNDLHIHYSYGNPFDVDIQNYDVADTFWETDGTRHVVDEQITIFPYDTRWPQWFAEERDFLRMGGIDDAIHVEHVGSTAVIGMASVPHLDMLVGADVPTDVQNAPFDLKQHGYEYLGDRLINGHRCYRKRGPKAFNLYVASYDGEFWRRTIQLRDYLLQHPDEREAYSKEKVRILNSGSWTLVRYLRGRAPFFAQLLNRAAQL